MVQDTVGVIDTKIEESKVVVAKILNCKQQIKEATNAHASGIKSPVPCTVSTVLSKLPLPKLVLSKFRGDVKNWELLHICRTQQ